MIISDNNLIISSTLHKKMAIEKFKDNLIDLRTIIEIVGKIEISEGL